jgi:hypothetical protein
MYSCCGWQLLARLKTDVKRRARSLPESACAIQTQIIAVTSGNKTTVWARKNCLSGETKHRSQWLRFVWLDGGFVDLLAAHC